MLLRFDANLRGQSFAALDPLVILTDIEETAAEADIETAKRALHAGTRLTYSRRRQLSIRLKFVIREYNPEQRARLMDKVADWVGDGGWLTLSTRPNQRLYVHPDGLPSMGSSLRWTDEMELTLTAYERPFFESRWASTAIISDSGTIALTGTVPEAYVEVDATNAGDGDLTTITLTCGATSITLEDLQVAPGEHVRLYYTDRDVLVIEAAGESALSHRTAGSNDDLIAATRRHTDIAVTADQPVSAVFSARGRWR